MDERASGHRTDELQPTAARARKWGWAALVAFVLLARVAMIRQAMAYPTGAWMTDSGDYLALADSIRLRGQFTTGPDDDYDRTLGYPLFLAAFLSLPTRGLRFALVAQQLLLLTSCLIVYRLGRSRFGEDVGRAAGLCLALSPNSLFWAGTILSETLATFWLTAAFLLAAHAMLRLRLSQAAGGGISVALATLTRPIAWYLAPIWTVLLALVGGRTSTRAIRMRLAAVFLAGALVPIGLWVTRNYIVLGQPMISTVSGRTFRDFQLARVVAEVEGISRDDASALMASAPNPTSYALEVALEHPGVFVKVNVLGIVRTILGTEVGSWLIVLGQGYSGTGMMAAISRGSWAEVFEAAQRLMSGDRGWLAIGLLSWGLTYTAALGLLVGRGLWRSRTVFQSERWVPIGLSLATAAYLILIPLANGDARFRVPAEPFLAFLAGMAWWRADLAHGAKSVGGLVAEGTPLPLAIDRVHHDTA